MTIYNNARQDSGLLHVEFTPTAHGNMAFFTLANAQQRDAWVAWLSTPEIGQKITVQSSLGESWVVVTHGNRSPESLLALLTAHGEIPVASVQKKPTSWWAWRGVLGLGGQALQLASALTQIQKTDNQWVRKGFSFDIGIFAILNIIANLGNIFYGGQKEEDIHRERYIKHRINEQVAPNLRDGKILPDPDTLRETIDEKPVTHNVLSTINGFLRRNSVRFFELGLRYVAAIALVIPFRKHTLSEGVGLAAQGNWSAAWKTVRNPNAITRHAGEAFLIGKSIAWFSKVADPYSPKPHSWIDSMRETVLFPLGSLIEWIAGLFIVKNAISSNSITLKRSNNGDLIPHRDWFGAIGGGMFSAAYLTRLGADFGSKHIDHDAVIAHAAEALAQAPPERLPQLAADAAATLTQHFADQRISFGECYQRIHADLQRIHPALYRISETYPELAERIEGKWTKFSDQLKSSRNAAWGLANRAA